MTRAVLGGTDLDPARVAKIDDAKSVVNQLNTHPTARDRFVSRLREILDPHAAHADDGSQEFFTTNPETLFKVFGDPVIAPPPAGTGGAAAVGGAAGLRDMFSGAAAAARRIANFVTYYQMKDRAGTVGQAGVGPLINRLLEKAPSLRAHLVGHSFGGRLVTAAAAALRSGVCASSATLLQAAYSHNGLAQNFDSAGHDGFFRSVIVDGKVSGPIVITHTKNDKAVGIAYPLASRIASQKAAALGDRNDPYGGMGRNGAQRTPEVDASENQLREVGRNYLFQKKRIYNLLADAYISDHGDVAGKQVASALLDAIEVG